MGTIICYNVTGDPNNPNNRKDPLLADIVEQGGGNDLTGVFFANNPPTNPTPFRIGVQSDVPELSTPPLFTAGLIALLAYKWQRAR
jgi:hypothetical protein